MSIVMIGGRSVGSEVLNHARVGFPRLLRRFAVKSYGHLRRFWGSTNVSDYDCKTTELIGLIISHLISFYVDIETFTIA